MKIKVVIITCFLFHAAAQCQTVWATVDDNGAVTGFYANAVPAPAPDHCCTAIDLNDSRIGLYLNPVPSVMQLNAAAYASALSSGVVVSCARSATVCAPANAGIYAVPNASGGQANSAAQQNITSVETSIAAGRGLPGGGSTFNYFDASGAPHAFTAEQWSAFATAMMNYSYALQNAYLSAVNSGGAFVAPSNNVILQ